MDVLNNTNAFETPENDLTITLEDKQNKLKIDSTKSR